MESLKKLFLWNTRITAKAIADFKAQHPHVSHRRIVAIAV